MKYDNLNDGRHKEVHIFDEVFDFATRDKIYQYVTNSLYKVGEFDGSLLENRKTSTLISTYNLGDVEALGLNKLPPEISKILDGYIPHRAYVNLCRPDDSFHIHTDHSTKMWTLLYYVNLDWHIEWGGDTVLLKEDMTIDYVSQYTPGRVLLFDGTIPHLIRPSTRLAPENRFTLAIKYYPEELD